MPAWNIFRLAADLSHITAKCILIFSIHRNRSAEGVSLITQAFYALVFLSRYTDLFQEVWPWNFFFKVFYILSSFYTIGIMRFVYPRTREREIAWKMSAAVLAGCLVLSPFVMLIFRPSDEYSFREWLWVFSQILESVCVLPQLLLLRQTTVPTVITSFYIVFLGSYRGLYLVNWILREFDTNDRKPNNVSVIFGIVQTAFYVDFAWVYWTRQRVKLRNGGVVDADDLRRGWLLNRIFGNKHLAHDDDEESGPALGRGGAAGANHIPADNGARGASRAKWGSRGISVSADDGVLDHERLLSEQEQGVTDGVVDPDAKMHDPDDLARALDLDDDDDDHDDAPLPRTKGHADSRGEASGIRNGDEWDDD
ncbi:ER lumen protein retaining receptor-domain-containing protein [Podospora appendiculata]|uniref:ER lumen protein retaining receptor-domain-containing protein n=1 Tax=Podospora appendiculata TaxID=314037 RepID=A0AAE1CH93_9PEZI|nr:ER lumen protein retaining receptor-domain-containing protein [Podospora appendiculata]